MKQPKPKTLDEKKADDSHQVGTIDGIPLSFDSPESSLVVFACYDPDSQMLSIDFKGAKTYTYTVPSDVWKEFYRATSKGAYFGKAIRPMYAGKEKK